jgi:CRISPR-associated protein Cmr6
MRYPLPHDTAEILRARIGNNRNLGLALDKYLQIQNEVGGQVLGDTWGNEWKLTDETKKRRNIPSLNNPPMPALISRVRQRHQSLLSDFQQREFTMKQFEATPDYRFVVGFGAEHVLETNICLHRIYGFPIVPGSALKGLTRARAFWHLAEQLEVPPGCLEQLDELLREGDGEKQRNIWEEITNCDEVTTWSPQEKDLSRWQNAARDFYQIFGTTERGGGVVFFDAYPVGAPAVETDILNPHYGEYYQDETNQKPPADYYNPVPTFFLTVAKGSRFEFAIASKDSALAETAESWLKQALTELGIGGKTTAGYGFWNPPA